MLPVCNRTFIQSYSFLFLASCEAIDDQPKAVEKAASKRKNYQVAANIVKKRSNAFGMLLNMSRLEREICQIAHKSAKWKI